MVSVVVKCEACANSWKLTGNWSPLVREAVESRACPKCGAQALCCTEPAADAPKRFRPTKDERRAAMAACAK